MRRTTWIIVGIAALMLVALDGFYIVKETEQTLVLRFGQNQVVRQEPGLYPKIPLVDDVVYYEKRILALDADSEEVIASDQKRLVVDAFARYRISDPLRYYQTVRETVRAENRLQSLMDSSLRQVLGREEFAAVLSDQRPVLMAEIRDLVNEQASEFGLDVLDVRIKRADLPDENSQAIFRRMQADRVREANEFRAQGEEAFLTITSDAERQQTVILANAQRDAEIERGTGDARAIEIFAEAYGSDVEFFEFYRSLQAYRNALNFEDTTMVLSPDSAFLRYFRDEAGK